MRVPRRPARCAAGSPSLRPGQALPALSCTWGATTQTSPEGAAGFSTGREPWGERGVTTRTSPEGAIESLPDVALVVGNVIFLEKRQKLLLE